MGGEGENLHVICDKKGNVLKNGDIIAFFNFISEIFVYGGDLVVRTPSCRGEKVSLSLCCLLPPRLKAL